MYRPKVSLTESLSVILSNSEESFDPSSYAGCYASQSLWTPSGARGVFGGQVIGQALQACSKTVTGSMGLHSQHCYFLLPADASIPILYVVEKLRDGKSYTTRLVRAIQKGRPVFILLASYTLPPVSLPALKSSTPTPFSFVPTTALKNPTGRTAPHLSNSLRFALPPSSSGSAAPLHLPSSATPGGNQDGSKDFTSIYQIPFPTDFLTWDECVIEEERWRSFLDRKGSSYDGRRRKAVEDYIEERRQSPISIAVARRRGPYEDDGNTRMIWLKARLGPGERLDEETTRAMFAYMTDFQFIGTASRSVGLTRTSTPRLGMLASLDHTTHFYPLPQDFDPASPLLHMMDSPLTNVAAGRGVVRGLLYTAEGILVATTLQEGVVRADLGKEERGLVEGGGVGDDDISERKKAKL